MSFVHLKDIKNINTKFIAEIGINHSGNLDVAKKLIDLASISGAWAVKFQKRNPDKCVPKKQKNISKTTPKGDMKYIEYKYKMEFGLKEYKEIDKYCKQKNILWSVSIWDEDSLNFIIKNFPHVPFIKIPSPKIVNLSLIKKAAKWCHINDKKLIISRGMSNEKEIDEAMIAAYSVDLYYDQIILMHCNSTYPTPLHESNINCIKTLKNKYQNSLIGFSDHSLSHIPCCLAVSLGVEYLEKHITLDKNMWGSDQRASADPIDLMSLMHYIHETEICLGNGSIIVNESEKEKRKSLRG